MEVILSDSLVGRKIGHYELQEIIGRGGMAVVYRAAQPRAAPPNASLTKNWSRLPKAFGTWRARAPCAWS
mgnify:CR=1 FL=1